ESIENFVADYEGYAAMKDCYEAKMRLGYCRKQCYWKDVKAAILKSGKAKYDVEMKIECLMNLKLNEDESIVKRWYLRGLLAKYREKIKQRYPETYEETRDWAIKIEKFEKSDEFDIKKASIIEEESTYQTDPAVDELADAFSDLKICRV
ncbi:13119_t:CDS:2, partial [Racocetra persica]